MDFTPENNYGFSTKISEDYRKFIYENIVDYEDLNIISWLDYIPHDLMVAIRGQFSKQNGVVLVYSYKYPMGSREGLVIIDKDDPKKIIAYKNFVMS